MATSGDTLTDSVHFSCGYTSTIDRLIRPGSSAQCVGILQRGSTPNHMITVEQQHEWAAGSAPLVAAVGGEEARACPLGSPSLPPPSLCVCVCVCLALLLHAPHTHGTTIYNSPA